MNMLAKLSALTIAAMTLMVFAQCMSDLNKVQAKPTSNIILLARK